MACTQISRPTYLVPWPCAGAGDEGAEGERRQVARVARRSPQHNPRPYPTLESDNHVRRAVRKHAHGGRVPAAGWHSLTAWETVGGLECAL